MYSTDICGRAFPGLDGFIATVPSHATGNMDVHVLAAPMGIKVARYLAVFVLLSSGILCSSESSESSESLMTDGGAAAMWSQVINPFELSSSDMNVCIKTSLELATLHLTETELLDGCDSIYLPRTCRAISSGDISVSDLYLRVETYECCDGFLRDGNSCSEVCPALTYGPNCSLSCSCLNNGECNPVNGSCDCQPGWMGGHCERTCPNGRYGDRCITTCQCQNDGSCHPDTGGCLCPSNFAGDFCEISAGSAFPCGLCHQEGSIVCDFISGFCRCNDGWRGLYCAHTCQNRSYGDFCEATCQCINAVSCLPGNGSCVCLPGWLGEHCDQKCPTGFHGDGCQTRCLCPDDGGCDHVTGSCDSCPRGWMGQLCTLPCDDDHWGENCSRDCNCAESLNCDPVSGTCFDIEGPTDRSMAALSGGVIAAIVGSAVLLLILITIIAVAVIRCRSRRKPNLPRQHNALQANGTVSGHVAQTNTHGQANGTIRYQEDNRLSSAPAPLPRGPATFPRGVDPGNPSDGYETMRQDARITSSTSDPYIEIYDEIRTSQIDNPVYAGVDADAYEVPTRTLEREMQ
ncbi:multiple epidermal growth factor-like domains protein 11 [Patiria miniata]|uniref:EGF-like domain-containing protein n=1 Tax=Patiria miniata TaxID=46514 RepID=A0A914BQA8_PATMI|nr:multiple epidermal growth factor-like domains protein 11 [Patiria miniata]